MTSITANFIAQALMGGGLLAFLYGLYRKYTTAQQQLAQAEVANKVKTDMESIAGTAKVANEQVIDFQKAVEAFNSNNPGGGAGGSTPPDAS